MNTIYIIHTFGLPSHIFAQNEKKIQYDSINAEKLTGKVTNLATFLLVFLFTSSLTTDLNNENRGLNYPSLLDTMYFDVDDVREEVNVPSYVSTVQT